MCDNQHLTEVLNKIEHTLTTIQRRPPLDSTYLISATQPLVIDYKERRHLFVWSANALTLTLEDLGTLTVGTNVWVNIGFQEGMRLFATGQATTVPVFVRATDETVP